MKPAPFDYHAPTALGDAVALMAQHGDAAKPLAGGQSLVPLLSLRLARFEHLVDLNRLDELAGVERNNAELVVGAMARQHRAEHDPVIATAVPLLARATPLIGHFQIRNRGTIGGSLAHADPASEYPAVALALDATFEIAGGHGTRRVTAADFFLGTWTTAVAPDELLTAIRFPVWSGRCGFAIEEAARRHGDFAMVGAAAAVGLGNDGNVDRARIALFGIGPTPQRAFEAEGALIGTAPVDVDPKAAAELGELSLRDVTPPDDVHATAAYRRRAGAVLVARAITAALKEASA